MSSLVDVPVCQANAAAISISSDAVLADRRAYYNIFLVIF